MLTNLFAGGRSDMGVRNISGQGEECSGQRVGLGNRSDQDRLGGWVREEDMVGGLGITCQSSGERLEGPSYPWEETVV